ncbi:tetratricopeptide (TPR) repeat protein [Bradyrhizobium sp. AZCC 1588]|uniref:tetratricopeptide repeat protein n=1 Tax=unclassified Bradyrhizobium TaxID=2631580 RepID=UPI002FEFB17D
MSRLAQTVLALAAIFVATRRNLNAGDFISRGVGGIDERNNKSTGYFHHEMEMRALRRLVCLATIHANVVSGFGGRNCEMLWLGSREVLGSYADKKFWRWHHRLPLQTASFRQLAFTLPACLVIIGGMADPAQAEDQQRQRIVSACRSNSPPSAAGKIPDGPPKNREAGRLAASAAPVMFAGGFEKAIERLNQAIELDPDNPHFRLNRGSAYAGNRQFDKAIEDYDRAIAIDPSSSLAFLARAEAYVRMADYEHAIEDFGEAIRLFPGNARAYLTRGTTYANKREYDRAIEDLDQSIKLDPECPTGYLTRALLFKLKGDRGRADADYDHAIKLDPDPGNARTFLRRAGAYGGKQDYNRAMEDLGQALKLEPRNVYALNNRCLFRAILGSFDAALADCDEALRIRPDDANILHTRGIAYLKKGALDRSIGDYDAALRIDAKKAASLYGRAIAKRQKSDVEGSKADISAALALRPNVADELAIYGIK